MAHNNLRERLLSTKAEQPGWWMVERDDRETRPLYLTMPGGAGGWSSDWREGFKFQEREHAEQQVELWHRDYGHARSHGMMVEFVNPDGPEAAETIERLTAAWNNRTPAEPLAEALKPFAAALDEWGDEPLMADGNKPEALAGLVTLGDFRKARAAIAAYNPNDRLREALEASRRALQRMMDTWLDYHDAHSLTEPVTGASANAFDDALAARDMIDAALSHKD